MGRIIVPSEWKKKRTARAWDAAATNRLTIGWVGAHALPSDEVRQALPTLRARARQLAQNNEFARRFLQLVEANVVGPYGIRMQCRVPDGRRDIDAAVEDAWAEWCEAGTPTAEGRMSFVQFLRYAMHCIARDGEMLAIYLRGSAAENRFGFALQLLDIALLDEQRTGSDPPVYMGIEYDAKHRPVAYWIRQANASSLTPKGAERIDASRVLHAFHVEHSLLRGIPWMAPVMMRMQMLGGYQEAEVTAARIAASKVGFFTRTATAADLDMDESQNTGSPNTDVEPGTFEVLPSGWDVKAWDADHPSEAFGDFVSLCLRGIASGLGVAYHSLTGDLSDANYSSLREAKLADSDAWRMLQQSAIDMLCRPIFSRWLEMAITSGAVPLSMADYPLVLRSVSWQGRGWQWVDPEKEMNAYEKALSLNLMSRAEILAAQGKDLEDTLREIRREQELMAEILMEQQNVLQDVRRLIDRIEERHDEYRAKNAEQILELRAECAQLKLKISDAETLCARLAEQQSESAKAIYSLGQSIELHKGEVAKRLDELRASTEQALAAAKGAQRVADRLESRVATADTKIEVLQKNRTKQLIGTSMQRTLKLEVSGMLTRDGSDARRFDLAFSSEEPYERWFGIEVLDHRPGAVVLDFLASGRAPVLFNHDTDKIIGRVLSARIDPDRRGRATVELPAGDPDADWAANKIAAKTLANVSVGYMIEDAKDATDEAGRDIVLVTRWRPLEISLVSVPADTTVGLGRSAAADEHTDKDTSADQPAGAEPTDNGETNVNGTT
ncbi:MAG: phage portal protein [Gammaproteobacteria bacterium]|nr:phage portal protein [Gammaproteobacteria bacterium]